MSLFWPPYWSRVKFVSFGIKTLGICHDWGSIKHGNLYYQSSFIIVRTRAIITKFCCVWCNDVCSLLTHLQHNAFSHCLKFVFWSVLIVILWGRKQSQIENLILKLSVFLHRCATSAMLLIIIWFDSIIRQRFFLESRFLYTNTFVLHSLSHNITIFFIILESLSQI